MASFEAFACDSCKGLLARPHTSCRRCGASIIQSVKLSGRGTLLSFTTIQVPPAAFQGQEPYAIAVIELEEGLRVTARLTVPAGREAGIGDPVEFEEMAEYGPVFRLIWKITSPLPPFGGEGEGEGGRKHAHDCRDPDGLRA